MNKYTTVKISYTPDNLTSPPTEKGYYVCLQRADDKQWEIASEPYKTYNEAIPMAVRLIGSLNVRLLG